MNKTAQQKRRAAHRAVEWVESGMVVGLGTGSTTRFALERIAERLKTSKLHNIVGIPSSLQTEKLARELGIPLSGLDAHPEIDITIDGADEVDPLLDLIKGGGGALLREKVLAQASARNVIIVDESKLVAQLGATWPLPLEVVPFACNAEKRYLESLKSEVRLRRDSNGDPFATDQGNWILDARFSPAIRDARELAHLLEPRAGIVAHGLFLNLATEVVVAGKDGVRVMERR